MAISMNLFVGRIHIHIHCVNQIRTTALASPPNPNPLQALAVQYLVQSFGLSSGKALKASKHIHHLKSFDKPDVVLRFLREIGISESDIKTAVSQDARFLCSHVEKNLRPNIAKLQQLGFSIADISCFIASNPYHFRANFVQKIDFIIGVLGSVDNLSLILKSPRYSSLLHSSLEKVIIQNLSFLGINVVYLLVKLPG